MSSTGSPAPKQSRTNRPRHRHTKSGSSIAPAAATAAKVSYSQHRQQTFHHTAHQLQNPPPRTSDSSPQLMKSENSKKKRKPRKTKDVPSKSSPEKSSPITILPRGQDPEPGLFDMDPVTFDGPTSPHNTPNKPTPNATPAKAYAGPTFQHSPAPSSLPVPKFFSKSVPVTRPVGLQAMMEEDESSDGSLSPSPANQQSPLQKLFDADKHERERQRNESSDSESGSASQKGSSSASEPGSPIRNPFGASSNGTRPLIEKYNSEPFFKMDMDGTTKVGLSSMAPKGDAVMDAKLRRFLFQAPRSADRVPTTSSVLSPGQNRSLRSSEKPSSPSAFDGNALNSTPPTFHQRRSSYYTDSAGGSPLTPKSNRRPISTGYSQPHKTPTFAKSPVSNHCVPMAAPVAHDIAKMENDLRRILRLGPHSPAPMAGGVMI